MNYLAVSQAKIGDGWTVEGLLLLLVIIVIVLLVTRRR